MTMACRPGCGACCIAPSIATPFAGMPNGKRAGERCVHLTGDARCALFGHPDRPRFCAELRPEPAMCGTSAAEALAILTELEQRTRPARIGTAERRV
jgi:Fe-S-cluster containining protein